MKKFIVNNSYAQVSQDDCDDNALVLDIVYVDPAERGKGLGTQLTKMAIEYAQSEGKELGLYAEPQEDEIDGQRLVEFYRGLGFVSDGDCDQLMTYKS